MDVLTDRTHLSGLSNGEKRTEHRRNGLESKEVQNDGTRVQSIFLMACVITNFFNGIHVKASRFNHKISTFLTRIFHCSIAKFMLNKYIRGTCKNCN